MPPKYIAQTSTEAKKAYKKNGPTISDSTHKQLQRGHELEQRAEREREAEKRRKLAKEKRIEREQKEDQIRKQIGVGLATQLIGYSHTQAHLKKGMEAFLGISKKQEQESRRKAEEKRREEELAKHLEAIAQDIENEPFDVDEDLDNAMLDLPIMSVQDTGSWVDDDLDDDTLLEVHDLIMSDPVCGPSNEPLPIPARSATTPPTLQSRPLSKSVYSSTSKVVSYLQSSLREQDTVQEDVEFTRTHGPVNKTVEAALRNLPSEIIELLSHDSPAVGTDWNPAQSLIHKLNPAGLPPHRLRVKPGCVLVCLRDLNTSSQLSKSQHVRVLKVGNERLECLTLDGQLAGTKTVITRVPFPARYRNDDKYPFTRTQYPVRVATDYVSTDFPQDVTPSGFKLPLMKGRAQLPALVKKPTPPASKPRSQISPNPSFKLPGLPASRARAPVPSNPPASLQVTAATQLALDGWDDFLESGTQIARELSADPAPQKSPPESFAQPSVFTDSAASLSAQDFDFSLDDLDDEPQAHSLDSKSGTKTAAKVEVPEVKNAMPEVRAANPKRIVKGPPSVPRGPLSRTANIRRIDTESAEMPPPRVLLQKSRQANKRPMAPPPKPLPPAKKLCEAPPKPVLLTSVTTNSKRFSDFGMSTQEATSFFDDDDDFAFGSPPIAV
jgi:hypothetical protein